MLTQMPSRLRDGCVVFDQGEPGSDTNVQILEFIRKHPGSHLRELQREMNVAMGTIQYHLYNLERERKVVSRRNRGQRRFYANLVFGDQQIDILDILSQEVERDIIFYLIRNPSSTQKDLSLFLNRSPATTYFHMRKLTEAGFLEARHDGVFVRYDLTCDQSEVLSLIRNYHPGIWERWANRLADLLTEASGMEERSGKKEGVDE